MTLRQARLAKLVRLTAWEQPEHLMALTYVSPVPTHEIVPYRDWLQRERDRINAAPTRVAGIVEQGDMCALYVNPVAAME